MAMHIKADPKKSKKMFPADLVNRPKANNSNEETKSFSRPTIADMRGINVENKEKQMSGMAVMSPTSAGVSWKANVISGITGPIDVMGARRFVAIRIMLSMIIAVRQLIFLFTMPSIIVNENSR